MHAHREDSPNHGLCLAEIRDLLGSPASFAIAPLALSGFVRIVTHPRVFDPPTPLNLALSFCRYLLDQPQAIPLQPGNRHCQIFEQLVQEAGCKGNLVPDAYFAALAIEHGCQWLTLDRDFARFPRLHWRLPRTQD